MWFWIVAIIDIVIFLILPWWLFNIPYWIHLPIVFLYWIWTPQESERFRSFKGWDDLFDVRFEGSPFLPSDCQCIYALHPHGAYAVSTIAQFALNKDMLHVKPVGSSILFLLPLIKELVGLVGTVRANRSDILTALACGDSLAMCPGGIRELPGLDDPRKMVENGFIQRDGFIKIAKTQHVPVVPIWVDGEEALYDIWHWSPSIERALLHWFYYPGFVIARGLPWLPFWPKSKPMTLYVGEPIAPEELSQELFYAKMGELRDHSQNQIDKNKMK